MTSRERFLNILNFKNPKDRMPMVEWAAWWDKTVERWQGEGMPVCDFDQSLEYFDLDPMVCIYGNAISPDCPPPSFHGAPLIESEEDYERIKPFLFTHSLIESLKSTALQLKERHDRGEIIIRLWLDGFFWFPRSLFGIEGHLFAFYDYPELMHQMNTDLTDYNIRIIDELCTILKPDMVGLAEDMSYNHGPMLSYDLFQKFLLPYYQKLVPEIKKHGIKVLTDSDGDITNMIPWLQQAGLDGIYPLERQAGVDIWKIRQAYPDFLMLGGYNKMVMNQGEAAMRSEFERILPVMKSGGYIPSVDHQTPPGVSFEDYKIYIKLFKEYCKKAVL